MASCSGVGPLAHTETVRCGHGRCETVGNGIEITDVLCAACLEADFHYRRAFRFYCIDLAFRVQEFGNGADT